MGPRRRRRLAGVIRWETATFGCLFFLHTYLLIIYPSVLCSYSWMVVSDEWHTPRRRRRYILYSAGEVWCVELLLALAGR